GRGGGVGGWPGSGGERPWNGRSLLAWCLSPQEAVARTIANALPKRTATTTNPTSPAITHFGTSHLPRPVGGGGGGGDEASAAGVASVGSTGSVGFVGCSLAAFSSSAPFVRTRIVGGQFGRPPPKRGDPLGRWAGVRPPPRAARRRPRSSPRGAQRRPRRVRRGLPPPPLRPSVRVRRRRPLGPPAAPLRAS